MLLGFKSRFAPFVADGSKTHTIRGARKFTPKAGEMCHCYVNPRQKSMKLLGRFPCVKVEPVSIYERGDGTFGFFIAGHELSHDEKDAFAWRDGFRSGINNTGAFVEMVRFWMQNHGDGRVILADRESGGPYAVTKGETLEFNGHVIHWRYVQIDAAKRNGVEYDFAREAE